MFTTQLILHLCKRFYLRGIKTLTINPALKTQMILGSNGSGKSSLMNIGFCVLPALASDFHRGGYKIQKLLHRGHSYELRSQFLGKSPEHYFFCDGEDLNPGRTAAVQKELVREHFGMTQGLHDVLTGETRFTQMSPLQRRDWITQLSAANFDFVLGLYGKTKSELRRYGILAKEYSGRLIEASSKQLSAEEITELHTRYEEEQQLLEVLHREISSQRGIDPQQLVTSLTAAQQLLETEVKDLLRVDLRPPLGVLPGKAEFIKSQYDEVQGQVRAYEQLVQHHSEQHQDLDRQLYDLRQMESVDPEQLKRDLAVLDAQLAQLRGNFRVNHPDITLPNDHRSIEVVEQFMEQVSAIDPDEAQQFTRSEVQAKRAQLEDLTERLQGTMGKLGEIQARLDHIARCDESHCPKCGHTFKEGIEVESEQTLRAAWEKGTQVSTELQRRCHDIRMYLGQARDFSNALHQIQELRSAHPRLSGFWALIDCNGGPQRGKALLPLCQQAIHDIRLNYEIEFMTMQRRPFVEQLAELNHLTSNAGGIREQHAKVTAQLEDAQRKLVAERQRASVLRQYWQHLVNTDDRAAQLRTKIDGYYQTLERLIESIRQDELNQLLRARQTTLALLNNTLTEVEVQTGIIRSLEVNQAEAQANEKALKILEQVLSPTDGIIAEQISVFINNLIERLNAVIARVWGYNLAIRPCDVSQGELDYRFPMYVHNEDNLIPDISKGSASQRDIIDQAFRLVVYKYLRLDGYPLYLDELGASFDEVHRHNLVPTIKDLIDDDTYSQVFIVSHYFDGQSSYPNSEIVVLDDSHLTLNRPYNLHVLIE